MRIKITNTFIAFGLGTALLAGCGGGDGGGGTSGLTYTGITTAAVIDETSAPELAAFAINVNSASEAAGVNTMLGVTISGTNEVAAVETLKLVANDALRLARQPRTDIAAGVSETVQGCGGVGSASMTYEVSAAELLQSATISYNSYQPWNEEETACEDQILNGTMSMAFTYVGPDGYGAYYPNTLTVTLGNLSASSGGITTTFSGNFSMTLAYDGAYDVTSVTFTMTANFSDGVLVYATKNYTEVWDAMADTFSIDGTVCHPLHGCVRLETTTPFALGACTLHPGIGVLRVIPSDINGVDGIGWVQIDVSAGTCDQYGVTYSIDGVVESSMSYHYW